MDLFSITKAIHIIFMVSYLTGTFYMMQLFAYYTEALEKDEPERSILHRQPSLVEERLRNIITVPAFIIMSVTGIYMFHLMDRAYFLFSWVHVKLLFVGILLWYHYYSWRITKRLRAGRTILTPLQLRMLNEAATLIPFVIVFAVVLKALFTTYWYLALLAFVTMGVLIMLIVKLINRK